LTLEQVRDKIPEIIRKNGGVSISHVASDEEFWQKLKEKLHEEVDEFMKDSNKEELTDILEIIYVIYDHKGFDKKELELLRKKKIEERRGFKNKIILDEVKQNQK